MAPLASRHDAALVEPLFSKQSAHMQALDPNTYDGAEHWVHEEFHRKYCNAQGVPMRPVRIDGFRTELQLQGKENVKAEFLDDICERLDKAVSKKICNQFALNGDGRFQDIADVVIKLHEMRPDLADKAIVSCVVVEIEEGNVASNVRRASRRDSGSTVTAVSTPQNGVAITSAVKSGGIPLQPTASKVSAPKVTKTTAAISPVKLESSAIPPPTKPKLSAGSTATPSSSVAVKTAPPSGRPRILNIKASVGKTPASPKTKLASATMVTMASAAVAPQPLAIVASDLFRDWVQLQYLEWGFGKEGFKGYNKVICQLCSMVSKEVDRNEIRDIFRKHRSKPHPHVDSLGDLEVLIHHPVRRQNLITAIRTRNPQLKSGPPSLYPDTATTQPKSKHPTLVFTPKPGQTTIQPVARPHSDIFSKLSLSALPTPSTGQTQAVSSQEATMFDFAFSNLNAGSNEIDLLARKLNQLSRPSATASQFEDPDDNESDPGLSTSSNGHFDERNMLMPDMFYDCDLGRELGSIYTEIQHSPLVSEEIIASGYKNQLPQYGFLGVHGKSKLFLNANVPFSAFICGVQGSGKSHTTAAILENCLIPSKHLGRLENPLSALVFSYGQFSGDGAGFSISEAAFLATANPKLPVQAHVKKITVLVSPSNYVKISKLYVRVPNVTVMPFKLKPWNLDIDIMLTLMAVNESDDVPLYMAQVGQILRQMAIEGGQFNYLEFKKKLGKCNFNPAQTNMLQIRLDLLESFLDLKNTCPEATFRSGEITIMDMSCPFVDANTACILFRIGLQRYLQSSVAGKMIVLDEAHKYMLNVPGAKALNETLLHTIRLQRHYGARIVISTQEPTLLTDLIALCSVTVLHRFSSPEWFSAVKRHIPMADQDPRQLMQDIESLKTGTGLVYSSNAVLGKDGEGKLEKGTGRLLKVSIRKRITSDGGQSVLAV